MKYWSLYEAAAATVKWWCQFNQTGSSLSYSNAVLYLIKYYKILLSLVKKFWIQRLILLLFFVLLAVLKTVSIRGSGCCEVDLHWLAGWGGSHSEPLRLLPACLTPAASSRGHLCLTLNAWLQTKDKRNGRDQSREISHGAQQWKHSGVLIIVYEVHGLVLRILFSTNFNMTTTYERSPLGQWPGPPCPRSSPHTCRCQRCPRLHGRWWGWMSHRWWPP